jgi:outer membrane protein OmpA-like peptidoglycan-associated protein
MNPELAGGEAFARASNEMRRWEDRMKVSRVLACIGALVLGAGLAGCSFSASASAGTKNGKQVLPAGEKIVVTAVQPAPPPPPPPPKPVVIMKAKRVGKKIEITEKVMFDTGKATIKVESDQLLKDVATVLTENASVTKLRIEGHTDSVGKDAANKKLSQKRADAVKEFLVKVGIDAARLESVGYGEEKPIASNDTDEGKEQNRRVEFNIVSESTPAAAPEEGAAEGEGTK